MSIFKNREVQNSFINNWIKFIILQKFLSKFESVFKSQKLFYQKNLQIQSEYFNLWKNSRNTEKSIIKAQQIRIQQIFINFLILKITHNKLIRKDLNKILEKIFIHFFYMKKVKEKLFVTFVRQNKFQYIVTKFYKNFIDYKYQLRAKFMKCSRSLFQNFERNKYLFKHQYFPIFFYQKQKSPMTFGINGPL